MPKIFSLEQKKLIFDLAAQGMGHSEIAKFMKDKYPEDWGAKNASKSVARILNTDSGSAGQALEHKTLDEMTREERFNFIDKRLQRTPRFKMAFKNFDDNEKDVFVDEYLNVIKSTDTLTEVEEQSLFAAILELILSFQA